MELRAQPRFTAQFRSTFSGNQLEGQGKTIDLSLGGCKIESEIGVEEGLHVECRLHVPGFDWPLRIEEAEVRWVREHIFGLAFIRVRPEEQEKLRQLIKELVEEDLHKS